MQFLTKNLELHIDEFVTFEKQISLSHFAIRRTHRSRKSAQIRIVFFLEILNRKNSKIIYKSVYKVLSV